MNATQPSLFAPAVACSVGGCQSEGDVEAWGYRFCQRHAATIEAQGEPISARSVVGRRALDAETEVRVLGREPAPAPYVRTSATSKAAAKAIQPHLSRLQRKVYELLQERGIVGASDEEGMLALSMNPSTYRPRRIELVSLGLVRDSGERRPTASGSGAVVWVTA